MLKKKKIIIIIIIILNIIVFLLLFMNKNVVLEATCFQSKIGSTTTKLQKEKSNHYYFAEIASTRTLII